MRSAEAIKKGINKERVGITDIIVKNIAMLCCCILLRSAGGETGCCLSLGLLAATLINLRKNAWSYSVTYTLSGLFFSFSQFLSSAAGALVLTAVYIIYLNVNVRPHRAMCVLYLLLAQVFYILYEFIDVNQLTIRLLGVGLSVLSAICFITVIKAFILKGARFLPSSEQLICLAIVSATLVAGLQHFNLLGTPLTRLIVPFILLTVASVFSGEKGTLVAAVLGLGASVASGELAVLAMFVLWAVAAATFIKMNRYVAAISVVFVDICAQLLFFKGVTFFAVVAPIASVLAFALLPTKLIERAKSRFSSRELYCSRHIVNRLRNNLSQRLYRLSDIFFAMQMTFKEMVRGVMSAEGARVAIVREVSDKVCMACPERVKCWRMHAGDTEASFLKMTESALDRGKATMLDINNALVARCGRVNSLLAAVNSEVYNYKQYYAMTVNADNSKILIAEQLSGVSQILRNLSRESNINVSFNTAKEREVTEALASVNIFCKEAIIYDDGTNMCVSAAIDSEDVKRVDLSEEISKAVKVPMMLDRTEATSDSAWVVAHFVPRPSFDIKFGYAGEKKYESEISGDTHSFLKISADKCLLALCDGMGSGRAAEAASGRAISLVENFYRAGFDNDTVLSSVNKLLATANEELFTAVDITVLDLKGGLADFIKIGAPSGLVKIGGTAEFIEGGSLPMGVLDEIRPVITKKVLGKGDVVFMFTDGVEQAFGGRTPLAEFIVSLGDEEPQCLADAIIEAACSINPKPKDDMTVIAARLI